MLRPFPVHFIPLQSNSTQPNVHDLHADTENCMKYGFSYETDYWGNYCVEILLNKFGHFMQMQITDNGISNRMLHVNHGREPHINEDSFISDSLSKRVILTVHRSDTLIKIPTLNATH